MKTYNIAIIDDCPVWRTLIEYQLHKSSLFKVCMQCEWIGDIESNIAHLSQADMVLLDIYLPTTDGYSIYKIIREHLPQLPVVVFSSSSHNYDISRFMHTDILGYINKCRIENLVEDLSVLLNLKHKNGYKYNPIKDEEMRLLHLVCMKKTNDEIAEQINVDAKTVENKLNKLCDKLYIEHKKIAVYEFCVQYGFWNPWKHTMVL